jgi:hypothetical protein
MIGKAQKRKYEKGQNKGKRGWGIMTSMAKKGIEKDEVFLC